MLALGWRKACLALSATLLATGAFAAEPAKITVKADQPGITVSPTLYGIFYEEINRAGDGGLYAEMLQNRSFEDIQRNALSVKNSDKPVGWELVQDGGAEASMTIDDSKPLNEKNTHSLKLSITKPGERAGVANIGFRHWTEKRNRQDLLNGVAVQKGKQYNFSLYARCADDFKGPLTVRIVGKNGVLAEGAVKGVGADWKKFEVALKAKDTDPDTKLVVTAASAGTLWLDMVSLIPKETFKNHGLRLDLAQMVANMQPKFVRFPGGCVVEGDPVIENAVRWKKSIGPVEERVGHWDLWGYWSNEGLGYHEFLQFCEDIKAEPMYVINCGMSHKEERAQKENPNLDLQEFIQDALDAIEYANGPADSKWGALRAKAGHPKPFNMKLMEIGNENGGQIYKDHYEKFRTAIKEKYPEMKLIACDWRGGTPKEELLDIVDEHYYSDPGFFMRSTGKYDKYDRKKHKVYVGEYAVTKSCGKGNLIAGVGEAAFMTGMERNSDIVEMASYAPLFVNPAWEAWNPNAIVFDASRAYGTPSYHVQTMFGNNKPDVILPLELVSAATTQQNLSGGIGVGSWSTQTEYKDIQVTGPDGSTLFQTGDIKDMSGWKTDKGQWEAKNGQFTQTNKDTPALAFLDGKSFGNCTLTLKARKTGGDEGFLILFQSTNLNDRTWWNIGGWGNKQSGLEGGDLPDERKNLVIETGRWYDLKVEMDGQRVKCSVDGKVIHDVTRSASKSLFAVAGRKKDTNEVILKVVNGGATPQDVSLELTGTKSLASTGKAIVLTSEKTSDENTFAEPTKIAPKEEKLEGVSAKMQRTFPPYSVTILRLQEKK